MNPAAPSILQHGFTLIECMIAMTLGMLIIAAATALLLTAQQTYFAIDGNAAGGRLFLYSSMWRNGRFPALRDLPGAEIRRTGSGFRSSRL